MRTTSTGWTFPKGGVVSGPQKKHREKLHDSWAMRNGTQGTWRATALIVNGETFTQENANALTVVNGADGTWIIRDLGTEKSKGTSTIDPTKSPKTIDITPSGEQDKGITYLGIYELGENTRKVCIAPSGRARPKDFTSTPGSERILVTFERVKDK